MEHMDHATATAPPGKYLRPEHGTWEGHVLPGSFFVIWSLWWFYGNFRLYLKANGKRPYKSRSWYEFPTTGSKYPLEPILKVLLPFFGINAELWAGHVSYRRLYNESTGQFEQGNIQDWQHSAMYAAFMASGAVDLVGFYTKPGTLPHGTEHGFLGLALLIEGLLFAFHLKGTALDMKLHLLLVLVVFSASVLCFAEIASPHSLLLSTGRIQLVLLQGLWFYQIAQILFRDNPAWDPNTHGAVMMVPFFFVMWLLVVALGSLTVYVSISIYRQRKQAYRAVSRDEEAWAGNQNGHRSNQPELEISTSSSHQN